MGSHVGQIIKESYWKNPSLQRQSFNDPNILVSGDLQVIHDYELLHVSQKGLHD
jgi:hypothetical protein